MKLHIGCGSIHKKGYINIDLHNKTADRIMDARDLQFKDNCVDLIESYQLIEHLGYIGCLYALAEWFRILKPNGNLIIETPDIGKLFKTYLKEKTYQKKIDNLVLIFGTESLGNAHKFCFSKAILENLLKGIGFIAIKIKHSANKSIPSLHVECKKPVNCSAHQVIAKLKRKLIKERIVKLDDLDTLAIEDLLDFFRENIKNQEKIIAKGKIVSPVITNMFLKELKSIR